MGWDVLLLGGPKTRAARAKFKPTFYMGIKSMAFLLDGQYTGLKKYFAVNLDSDLWKSRKTKAKRKAK